MALTRRILLQASAAALAANGPAAHAADPGAPLVAWPAITLLDGSTLAPASWQGLGAVVVFWAIWCPYCRRHNVHVDALHRAVQGQPLRVLGVALERDTDAVRRHMAATGHAFPVALDAAGEVRQRFTSRRVIPMTCVVDRGGRLLQAIPGEMAADDVAGLARLALRPGG